ncbi:MAG: hypothetical protein RL571_56 [Pseudomonadota bacterium]|jgi:pyruvate formate lyase activating enzyme
MMPAPKIGGLVPFSSCDYPGELACVVFLAGCPWRCGYCHNPHLQAREQHDAAPQWDEILIWLKTRRGLLDAVVFSGGEPLIEPQLPEMMRSVKALGFKIGLHSGGSYPKRLQECLPYLDWVGFDIKSDFLHYEKITTVVGSGAVASASLKLLLASKVALECRSTIHPSLHSEDELIALARTLSAAGVQRYVLQSFRPAGCIEPALINSAQLHFPQPATLAAIEQQFASFRYVSALAV